MSVSHLLAGPGRNDSWRVGRSDRSAARHLPLLGVLVAGALMLSACGGSPEGEPRSGSHEPSEPTSASASSPGDDGGSGEESPSASDASRGADEARDDGEGLDEPVSASSEGPARNLPVPQAPPEMAQETDDGAESAATYWVELFEYGRRSGDTEPIRDMTSDDCSKCSTQIDHIDEVFGQGAWYVNAAYEVDRVSMTVTGGEARGVVAISAPDFTVIEEDGTTHSGEGMDSARFDFGMELRDSQWVVVDWSTLVESDGAGSPEP